MTHCRDMRSRDWVGTSITVGQTSIRQLSLASLFRPPTGDELDFGDDDRGVVVLDTSVLLFLNFLSTLSLSMQGIVVGGGIEKVWVVSIRRWIDD